jgi:hypothetical protein
MPSSGSHEDRALANRHFWVAGALDMTESCQPLIDWFV